MGNSASEGTVRDVVEGFCTDPYPPSDTFSVDMSKVLEGELPSANAGWLPGSSSVARIALCSINPA
jgi:hypothetical protein